MSNVAERITVNLTAKSAAVLERLACAEGLNKTDLVNRAVQLYGFVQEQREMGRDLLVRNADGAVAEIHILG